MTRIADSRARAGPGIVPAQHHRHDEQAYPTHARIGQMSARIVAREEPSEVSGLERPPAYVHEDNSIRMDHGKFLAPEPRGEEPLGQWGWVQSSRSTLTIRDPFGAGTEERGETPSGAPPGGAGGVLTDVDQDPPLPPFAANFQRDRDWSEDERLATLIPPMLPKQGGRDLWPELPRHDFVGLVVESTEENEQIEHWHPTDPRKISVNVAGHPKIGSWTGDLDGSNGIDLDRTAREQSHTRVVRKPAGCIDFGLNSLALQIGKSGKGDVRGGLVFDRDAGNKIGMLSHQQSGIVQAKCPSLKHVIGKDADGNEIASTHLPLDVLFTDDAGAYDGPLKHDGLWQGAIRAPYSVEVFFEFDPTLAHGHVCGSRFGRHRWRAETFWCSVPPPPPETPTPFEEPLDTVPFPGVGDEGLPGEGFVPGKGFPRETRGPETDRSGIDEGDLPADGTEQGGEQPTDDEQPPAVITRSEETFGEAPLEGLRDARQRGREERAQKQRFSDFRVVEPWQPEDGKRIFAGTHVDTAVPAILYRAQHFGDGALDFRSLMRLPTEATLGYNSTAPVVARDEAWGQQTEDRSFEYTDEPCKARYHGGTAPGGIALMPPERDLADFAASELPVRTTSRTYRLFEETVRVGWFSTLDFATGLPGGGPQWRHRRDFGLNRLELQGFDNLGIEIAAGAANNVELQIHGQLAVGTPSAQRIVYDPATGSLTIFNVAGTSQTVLTNSSSPNTFKAPLRGPRGSLASPGHGFTQDPDTGMFLPTTGELGIVVGATLITTARPDHLELHRAEHLSGVISPVIAADQDDWNPTGLASARIIRVDGGGAARAITGIVAQSGALVTLIAIGANAIDLFNESAGSSAANRIITATGATVSLATDDNATLWYDPTTSRWRIIAVQQ